MSAEEKNQLEKLFDQSNYKTLIIGNEVKSKDKKVNVSQLIKILKSENKEEKEILLDILKKENAQFALMEAIKDHNLREEWPILIAACWETGLDFSAYFNDFINLCIETDNFMVVLECCTLIQESEMKISEFDLENAIGIISEEILLKNDKEILLNDLKNHLIEMKISIPKDNDDL